MSDRVNLRKAVMVVMCCAGMCATAAHADTRTYNFNSGPGPAFDTFNSGDLFTLDLDGPELRVSKLVDDGLFNQNGFITGGIHSNFQLLGDFKVTVDFGLDEFPPAGGSPATLLIESVLRVVNDDFSEQFLTLRLRIGTGDKIESYSSIDGPLGYSNSSLYEGRYQIERIGDTMYGRYAEIGSDVFTTLGSSSGFQSEAFAVSLYAAQGSNNGGQRALDRMNITFDNLFVEAERITPIPTPGAMGMSLVGLGLLSLRRRVR